ncbi:E3 ubiquitin-protein ligase AMFR-like protein [Aphelenchoides avenae]|nr:E3 ubiquitin-protein ligase AMFR-like protein [Aphelenchus avenae]
MEEPSAEGSVEETPPENGDIQRGLVELVLRHRILLYVILNTCCALVTFAGKTLVAVLFDGLSAQEESTLRKSFRRFAQLKLTFLIFISHHNLIEDILMWMPWLAIHAVCLLLLEVSSSRMSNPYNVVSNKRVRQKLFVTSALTGVSSVLMMLFVHSIKSYLSLNYTLFLLADCCLLLVQSVHLLFKLSMLVDTSTRRGQTTSSSYYVDLIHDLFHDSIEFLNYLHMIFFSQLAVTYCCVFLVVQARHYYFRISSKIRKHIQHQKIIYHISTCYAEASHEDLEKNDACTICWEPMKSARKLPCGHIFHELCLRRWLEQDSSCAICRQALSLNLNSTLRGGVEDQAGIEVDPTLQFVVEAISPQNNRFSRWWRNFLFEPLNDDQISAMVDQISEMFPQTPRATVQEVLRQTGTVQQAIEALLEGRVNNDDAAQNVILESDDGSDESMASSDDISDTASEANDLHEHETSPLVDHTSLPDASCDTWFGSRRKHIVDVNRRKYLASSRADDIRHLFADQH